jgi:pre-mRNA cleavage complex 2 protein Pcf11
MLASMVQGGGGDISALLSSIAAAKKATTTGSPAGSTGVPLPAPPAGAPPPKGKRGDSPGASTGASKENQPPRLTPDFDPARDDEAELRKRREYLIDAMYGDMPHQCASTGRRFDDKAELDAHLDLQALRRRRRKEGTSSRRWCVDGDSWIAGAAAEAADDAPAFFEVDAAKKEEDDQRLVDLANSSVPKDDDVTHCALSGEPFEVFYKEDEDEWHFKKATTLPRDYKGVPAGSIVLVTALPKDADYDDEEEEEDEEDEEAAAPEVKEEPEMIEEPEPEEEPEPSPTPASKKRKAAVKVKEEVKEEKVEAAVEAVATRRSKRRKSE